MSLLIYLNLEPMYRRKPKYRRQSSPRTWRAWRATRYGTGFRAQDHPRDRGALAHGSQGFEPISVDACSRTYRAGQHGSALLGFPSNWKSVQALPCLIATGRLQLCCLLPSPSCLPQKVMVLSLFLPCLQSFWAFSQAKLGYSGARIP